MSRLDSHLQSFDSIDELQACAARSAVQQAEDAEQFTEAWGAALDRLHQQQAERRAEIAETIESIYRSQPWPSRDPFYVAVFNACGGRDLLRPSRSWERFQVSTQVYEFWAKVQAERAVERMVLLGTTRVQVS